MSDNNSKNIFQNIIKFDFNNCNYEQYSNVTKLVKEFEMSLDKVKSAS